MPLETLHKLGAAWSLLGLAGACTGQIGEPGALPAGGQGGQGGHPPWVVAPAGQTGGVAEVPTSDADLYLYLTARQYQWLPSVPTPQASTDHALIRVYLNPPLATSLAQRGSTHPQGAAAIREDYDPTGALVTGYGVLVKVLADSAGGDGWYFYEINTFLGSTTPTDSGFGVRRCVNCHDVSQSKDVVLGSFLFD